MSGIAVANAVVAPRRGLPPAQRGSLRGTIRRDPCRFAELYRIVARRKPTEDAHLYQLPVFRLNRPGVLSDELAPIIDLLPEALIGDWVALEGEDAPLRNPALPILCDLMEERFSEKDIEDLGDLGELYNVEWVRPRKGRGQIFMLVELDLEAAQTELGDDFEDYLRVLPKTHLLGWQYVPGERIAADRAQKEIKPLLRTV